MKQTANSVAQRHLLLGSELHDLAEGISEGAGCRFDRGLSAGGYGERVEGNRVVLRANDLCAHGEHVLRVLCDITLQIEDEGRASRRLSDLLDYGHRRPRIAGAVLAEYGAERSSAEAVWVPSR